MPDLGKYADTVLSAYGVSICLLLVIVWVSIRRAKKVKTALQEIEKKAKSSG